MALRSLDPASLRAANLVEFLLEGEIVEFIERKIDEERYASVQFRIRLEKSLPLVFIAALNRRRVMNAPMRRHRLAGPDRTRFGGGLITHREHEMHEGRVRSGELAPVLAVQS